MNRRNPLARLALAAAALAGLAPAATPAAQREAQPAQTATRGPQQKPRESTLRRLSRVTQAAPMMVPMAQPYIFQGRPKRGNRRGRSHWDYQR